METNNAHRDWRFELLRIIAMLLIVGNHFFASDNWQIHVNPSSNDIWKSAIHDSTAMLGQIGVVLFVLISSYFLCRSNASPKKRLIKLWIQVFVYSIGCLFLYTLCVRMNLLPKELSGYLNVHSILSSVLPVTYNAYWFVSAFFVMNLLSPFINRLFNNVSRREYITLTVIVCWITFIWKILNPQIQYFNDVAYLCAIYMIGTLIRNSSFSRAVRLWHVIIVVLSCELLCVIGTYIIKSGGSFISQFGYPANLLTAGSGASPILAVVAGSTIFLYVVQICKKARANETRFSEIVLILSPATLGVYLIHENFLLKPILWRAVFSNPEPSAFSAKILFSICVIVLLFLVLLLISYFVHVCITPIVNRITNAFCKE